VTVGTILEFTKLSYDTWIQAITLLCEVPTKGLGEAMHASLGITPSSMNTLVQRIMEARDKEPLSSRWNAAANQMWATRSWRSPREKLLLADLRAWSRSKKGRAPMTLWPLTASEAIKAVVQVGVRKPI
jgi:hypothetical protein